VVASRIIPGVTTVNLSETFLQALALLFSGDALLWEIIATSFAISLQAVLLISPLALLLAFALAYGRFAGRRVLLALCNSLLALPVIVIGLLLYLLLYSHGPLANLQLLFSRPAMVIGQMILAFPVVVVMAHSSLQDNDRRELETVQTLGAGALDLILTLIVEHRYAMLAAILAAFCRVIAEVGSSLLVGGNILHYTRNLSAAIAMETDKGAVSQSLALGLVALLLALGLQLLVSRFRGAGRVQQ